jgi:hypothetical protein
MDCVDGQGGFAGATKGAGRRPSETTRDARDVPKSLHLCVRLCQDRRAKELACVDSARDSLCLDEFAELTRKGAPPLIEFEIAQELWNLLIPLDPASSFPHEHLAMWISFLTEKGGRAVSKDSWNLVRPHSRRPRLSCGMFLLCLLTPF